MAAFTINDRTRSRAEPHLMRQPQGGGVGGRAGEKQLNGRRTCGDVPEGLIPQDQVLVAAHAVLIRGSKALRHQAARQHPAFKGLRQNALHDNSLAGLRPRPTARQRMEGGGMS